jgi:hypothetical protein
VAHEPGKGKTQKGVYVYALHKDAKAILLGGHSALSPFTLMEPPMFALKAPLRQMISALQTG